MATETATFGIKLTGDTAGANDAAAALEAVRRKVDEGNEKLKEMSASYRALRGATDGVKKAKDDLKAKMTAERDAISSANLSLVKQGTSYTALAKAAKASAADKMKAAKEAEEKEKDAAKDAKERADTLKGALGELPGSAGLMSLLADPITAVAAAVVAVTAALVAGAVAFTKWAFEGANALRTAGLLREAFAGGAANGEALGSQLDALAKKVKTPKAELQALSQSLIEGKLSGQTLVDALNAVGQAGAAGATKLKSTIQRVLEGGVLANGREGRAVVTPADLFGSGLEYSELAAAYGERMKIGVAQAQQALQRGGAKTADLAAAFAAATQKKFGKLNLAQMLDFDVLKAKAGELATALTKNIHLEPLLEGLGKVVALLDTSTASGKALRDIVGRVGNTLVDGFAAATPYVVASIKQMIIYGLELELAYYTVKNAILDAFQDHPAIKEFAKGIESIVSPSQLLDSALGGVASKASLMADSIGLAYGLLSKIVGLAKQGFDALKAIPWSEGGEAIVDGLILGLKSKNPALIAAVKEMGEGVKAAFKDSQEIHSPSAVFREYGEQTTAGYVQGLEAGSPDAHAAVREMGAARPSLGGASTGGGARPKVELNLTIHVPTEAAAAAMRTDASFMAQLVRGIEEINVMAGLPVQES